MGVGPHLTNYLRKTLQVSTIPQKETVNLTICYVVGNLSSFSVIAGRPLPIKQSKYAQIKAEAQPVPRLPDHPSAPL